MHHQSRLVLQYRGWVIKIFDVARNEPDWPVEWRLVAGRKVFDCPTSYRTYEGALQDARRSVDSLIKQSKEVSKCNRPRKWARWQV